MIRFDRRVRLTVAIGLILFAVQVGFKLHGSSIGVWNEEVSDAPNAHPGELFGWVHHIRADEWFTSTPWTLSQVMQGMPWHSENLGGKDAAALGGAVKSWTLIMRPAVWGYLFLDVERGFAWQWNYTMTAIFFAVFFVFLILTDSHYFLSLMGAFWITWSAYNQWWDGMGTLIPTCGVIIGGCYLLFATRTVAVVGGAVLVAYSSLQLGMSLYVPWMVGFGYLMVAIFVGLMLDRERREAFKSRFRLRAACALLALALIAAGTAAWYLPLRDTIQAMAHTEYPGKRVVNNAGYLTDWPRVFSGFYDEWYREKNFPASYHNVCEASSMIMLFPVVLLGLALDRRRGARPDRLVLALLIFCLGMVVWMTLGLPALLAKVTLLERAPPLRCTAALGVASILLTVVYLSRERPQPTGWWRIGAPLLCTALLLIHGWRLHAMEPFFTPRMILVIAVWGTGVAFALLERRLILFAVLILGMIAPNWLIHPTERGLGAFFEKNLWKRVHDMSKQEPSARWAVFGNVDIANFLKTTGATVVNGSNLVPDLPRWKPLDPDGTLVPKYNRYGHTHLNPGHDPKASFSIFDSTVLWLPPDRVFITVDPCSEQFRGMNVRYLAFSPEPADKAYTCLTPIGVESGVHLYRLGS